MTRRIAVAALLAAVAVPSSGFAQCSAADKSALEAFDKSWGETTVRGDPAAMGNFLADNYMAISLVGTVDKATTIANAVKAAEAAKANPQPAAVADRYVITCTGNSATITHRNVISAAAGSMAGPTYSRSVHFLEKRGGRWQAVANVGQPVSEQQQLVYMELDWNDADKNHDSGWYETNFAPFASSISSRTGAIENKAQSVASAKSDKNTYDVLELSELNARVDGDAAVVTGVNHVKGKDGAGKAFDRKLRFTDTYIKRDGKWQVWATQGTTIQ